MYDHIEKSVDSQVRLKWEPGTVVVWDNRICTHVCIFHLIRQDLLIGYHRLRSSTLTSPSQTGCGMGYELHHKRNNPSLLSMKENRPLDFESRSVLEHVLCSSERKDYSQRCVPTRPRRSCLDSIPVDRRQNHLGIELQRQQSLLFFSSSLWLDQPYSTYVEHRMGWSTPHYIMSSSAWSALWC